MQNITPNYAASISMFLVQLPTFVVCLVGLIVAAASWRKSPSGSLWAVIAFALALALGLIVPVGQQILWRFMEDTDVAARGRASSALGFFWSMWRGATYALLLVAVYAGRRGG